MVNLKNHRAITNEKDFLFDILKPYKYAILLFLFASFTASVFDGISIGLLIPLLSHLQENHTTDGFPRLLQWLTDTLRPYSPELQLIISVGCVIMAIVMKNILLGVAFKQGLWVSNRVCADIRLRAMELLLTVGIDFHYRSKMGELLDKVINYTQWLKDLFIASIQFIVFSLVFLILFFLILLLSWKLTLFSLLIGAFALVVMVFYLKQLSQLGSQQAEASRELTATVQENLSAVQLIQSNGKEHHQLLKLKENIQKYEQADNRLIVRSFWVQPITEGLGALTIGILLIGASIILSTDDVVSLPQLLPFLYILLRIVTTLKLLSDSRGIIVGRWPYLNLVYDLVREDNKPLITEGIGIFPGLERDIRFDSVSFSYEKDEIVLDDINFNIPRGKTTAIVGKSGSGKSTIVNLLLRFYEPEQGTVLIDDQPLNDFTLLSYRQKIGVVSQETFIFHETVKYNIAFGMAEPVSDERIIEAAKKADAHDFILELPAGYDTVLGDRGITLSGGQRQRISIARAILKNPEILILDEATSSLDTITERRIHNAMLELRHNRTVVIIAHRLSTIKNADQVIVLKEGCVAEIGKTEDLLIQKREYFDMVHTT